MQSNLSMKEHVDALITAGGNMLYALNILKHHGMNAGRLQQGFLLQSSFKILICIPSLVWHGRSRGEEIALTHFSEDQKSMDSIPRMEEHLRNSAIVPTINCSVKLKITQTMYFINFYLLNKLLPTISDNGPTITPCLTKTIGTLLTGSFTNILGISALPQAT